MMTDVYNYMDSFCEEERKTRQLDRDTQEIDSFNAQLDVMESYAQSSMRDSFGLLHRDKDLMEFLADDPFDDFPDNESEVSPETQAFIDNIDISIKKRIVFKIEAFNNDMYLVYTSVANPQGKTYANCFVLNHSFEDRKITARYFLASEDALHYQWRFNSGDPIDIMEFKNPTKVSFFESPDNDPLSLRLHNAT